MKVYKVGGCVRDEILGVEPKDYDFCIVGSTPEEMLSLGYQQVGKDFPVFIHPNTKCEYALARTERKTGQKHTDFEFDFNKDVTIEEDLARRDFTCNAIAIDTDTGDIIDPFNGRNDIKKKILRIVRPKTFVEDPLRVIRLARFSAQLDFNIEIETLLTCRNMVKDGMIDHLTPERIWKEFEKALHTNHFANFIKVMDWTNALDVILPEFTVLKIVPEIETHHPEKNTFAHTLLTLEYADKNDMPAIVKFGLLLHDIGKILTPDDVRPHHYGHEKRGLDLINQICDRLKVPNDFREFALKSCEYHMTLRRLYEMKPGKIYDIVEDITKGFRYVLPLSLLFEVSEADLYGRGKKPSDERKNQFDKSQSIAYNMNTILLNVSAGDFPELFERKLEGEEFGKMLRVKRIQYYLDNNFKKEEK